MMIWLASRLEVLRDFLSRAGAAALLFVTAAALSGCFNNRTGDFEYAPQDFGQPDEVVEEVLVPDTRIRPLDELSIRVFGVEDLSGDFTVGIRGTLDLPLLGVVPAAGLTPDQLSDRLEAMYADGYLRDPQIFVDLDRKVSNTVTMTGSWTDNGIYEWRPNLTLLRASALAGGTSPGANPRRTFIFRTIDGEQRVAAFDLSDIRRGRMQDPVVYPDDIIVVDGSATRDTLRDLLSTIPLLALFTRF